MIIFLLKKVYISLLLWKCVMCHLNNLVWSGGPVHLECEHGAELLKTGQYVRDNMIAIKAVTYNNEIYVITPRFKQGVIATVWLLVSGRQGPELQPYPSLSSQATGECTNIQNAVDVYLDHLGNLWVLDSGTVETLESPRCTCPPKVVVINIIFGKVTKTVNLSSLTTPTSLLQNIVVEYELGTKPFIYVSDAFRGAILVHEVLTGSEWSVLACAPATGLQIALVKRAPASHVLVLNQLHQHGLLELDTATLRRKNSAAPTRVFGEHSKRVILLGFDSHHIYMRHMECSDVLSWNVKEICNASDLLSIHSPGPRLTPTSVTSDPLKHVLLVLDSNYADTIHSNLPTYHRISYIAKT